MTASYTWSKAMGINAGNSDSGLRFYVPSQYSKNRAVADFDRTHSFVTAINYELPFGKGRAWARRWYCIARCRRMEAQPEYCLVLRHAVYCGLRDGSSLNAPGNTQVADQINANVANLGVWVWGFRSMIPLRLCPWFVRQTRLLARRRVSAIWDLMHSVVPNSST